MRGKLIVAAFIYIMALQMSMGLSYAAKQPETVSETDSQEKETVSTAETEETAETASEPAAIERINKEISSKQRMESQAEPMGGDVETKPVTESGTEPETAAAEDTDNDEEETEAFEEGNPEFLFQAGGFKVLNEDVSGISLYSTGDMDVLADKMYKSLKRRDEAIEVKDYGFYWSSTEDRNQLLTLYYAVINDHPDLYFARTGYGVSYNTTTKLISKIKPNYFINVDDAAFQAGVQKAKSTVTPEMDELQKAIAIHDYLVLNCEYDKERLSNGTIPQESYGAYGVLANRIAVCQGYALAYKYLMNEYGIDCYIVTSDKMNHAWNIVKIDGELYQMDATWDDPTWDRVGLVSHSNMFLSDTTFGKSHRDWYVTKGSGIIDLKAEGKKYDSAFWRDVKSPLVYDAGGTKKYYYVSSGKELQSRACSAQEIDADGTTLITLDTSNSGLALDGTKLYYNTSRNIAYIDISDSSYAEHVQFSLKDEDTNQIFGFIKNDDTIQYVKRTGESPSGKSTIYILNEKEDGFSEKEPGIHTVIFKDDFGTVFDVQEINEGGYAIPPNKKMTPQPGYQFSAWKGNYSNIQKDETVKAVYKKISYTIKYELNGGKNSKNPTKYDVETSDIILLDPLKREHYDFLGWYEEPEFVTKVTTIPKGSIGNRMLYARWELEKYAITYELDGGRNSADNKTEYNMETETFPLASPTKKGYVFEGWYEEPEFATKVTAIEKGSMGDRTLYAKWELEKYTITYEVNGGRNSADNKTEYNMETETFPLAGPTKKGYVFEGWYEELEFATKVTSIDKGSTGDRTVYAKWKVLEYDLEYEVNGGKNSPQNPQQYNIETDTIYLEAPSHEDSHYQFEGWYTDSSFLNPISSIIKGSTGNRRFYAKWTKYYRVRFFDSAGKLIAEAKTAEGKDAAAPKAVEMDGYLFVKWDKDYKNVQEDLDITALYEPIQYTITYVLGGGKNSSKNPAAYTIETEDFKFVSPKHKNKQLAFAGWYRDKGYKERIRFLIKGSMGDITLYAKWKRVETPQDESNDAPKDSNQQDNASQNNNTNNKDMVKPDAAKPKEPVIDNSSQTSTDQSLEIVPASPADNKNAAASHTEKSDSASAGIIGEIITPPDAETDLEMESKLESETDINTEKQTDELSTEIGNTRKDTQNDEDAQMKTNVSEKEKSSVGLWGFAAAVFVLTAVTGAAFWIYAQRKKDKDRDRIE